MSDSSVQSGQAGGANYRRGAGLEELDDIGDVSELLGGSEEETSELRLWLPLGRPYSSA